MLDLLCHKLNSLITTVVDGSIFFFFLIKTILERKMLEEDITFTLVLQYGIMINIKTLFLYG